jgi:hypothetical protein
MRAPACCCPPHASPTGRAPAPRRAAAAAAPGAPRFEVACARRARLGPRPTPRPLFAETEGDPGAPALTARDRAEPPPLPPRAFRSVAGAPSPAAPEALGPRSSLVKPGAPAPAPSTAARCLCGRFRATLQGTCQGPAALRGAPRRPCRPPHERRRPRAAAGRRVPRTPRAPARRRRPRPPARRARAGPRARAARPAAAAAPRSNRRPCPGPPLPETEPVLPAS